MIEIKMPKCRDDRAVVEIPTYIAETLIKFANDRETYVYDVLEALVDEQLEELAKTWDIVEH